MRLGIPSKVGQPTLTDFSAAHEFIEVAGEPRREKLEAETIGHIANCNRLLQLLRNVFMEINK